MFRKLARFAQFATTVSIAFAVAQPAWSQTHPSASLTVSGSANSSGQITIAFNGYSESVSYGQFSTPASIASAFAAKFAQDPISALPNLCTMGVCAKADGAKIVFQLSQPGATFGVLSVSPANSPFSFNAAGWPAAGATQIGISCDPSEIALGATTECTASLNGVTSGTVAFAVDYGTAETATIDGNGDATVTNVLQGAAAGVHLVTATYTAPGGATISGIAVVTVDSDPLAPGAPAGPVYSYNITSYAGNSNILAYNDSVTGTWSSIGYDSLNRLALATQTPRPVNGVAQASQYTCWNYDSFGNRLNQIQSAQPFPAGSGGTGSCQPNGSNYSVNSMQYNAANQITYGQWQGQTGGVPGYDGAGNMTSDLTNAYLYDPEGQVCAIQGPTIASIPGKITGYLYDAAGQRVAKGTLATMSCDPTLVVNGQPNFTATNVYVLGPGGEQMTELTPNPATGAMQWKHTNVYAAGSLIATYEADTASNTQPIHFQLADWLGSRRVQTDYAGNIEETCTSQPFGDAPSFGNLPDCTQTSIATADDATEHHFTGKERDAESGLDYFGTRYYGSNMGRFMSPDWSPKPLPVPFADLGNPQSLNLYAYVGNNPLSKADPDGHSPDWWQKLRNGLEFSHFVTDKNLEGALKSDADAARKKLSGLKNMLFDGQTPQDIAAHGSNLQAVLADRAATDYLTPMMIANAVNPCAGAGPGVSCGAVIPTGVVADYATEATVNSSAMFASEGEARAFARTKLGSDIIEVSPGKWRSADGRWQFRAKPGDVSDNHLHLELLNAQTGEVIQNLHLRWPEGMGR